MSTPYSADPTLYLYTSLTAGSSHIITATSRLETILKANKIPFRALDVATDEKARMLWGRRSKGRKLPGLVKFGTVVGDLEEIEEWNEYGELKQQIGKVPDVGGTPSNTPSKTSDATPSASAPIPAAQPTSVVPDGRHISISDPKEGTDTTASDDKQAQASTTVDSPLTLAMRQAGAEAAAKAGQKRSLNVASAAVRAGTSTTDGPGADRNADLTQIPAPSTNPKLATSASDPAHSTESTAAKTPTQLAAEGAKRTSVDKINESETTPNSQVNTASPPKPASESSESTQSAPKDTPLSNQEQVLSLHRDSSVTKAKSRLSTQLDPEDVAVANDSVENSPASERRSLEGSAPVMGQVRTHRGSSISLATKEEIAEIERRNAIPEEADEEEDEANKGKENVKSTKDQIDAVEPHAVEEEEEEEGEDSTQDQDAKESEKAGISVVD